MRSMVGLPICVRQMTKDRRVGFLKAIQTFNPAILDAWTTGTCMAGDRSFDVLACPDARQRALILSQAAPMPVVIRTRNYGAALRTA